MVARFRSCQSKECGREEHCLVIGMGDEKADALVAETGERRPYDLHRVQPCCCQNYGNGEDNVELHILLLGLEASLSSIHSEYTSECSWGKSNEAEALSWTGTCIRGVPSACYTLSPKP